ncbi:hypothetical protein NUW58_g5776 [Xylaria curta]|uniref:Uncharacterized protein n=1 Tax=Xylaria curta TaxID=42375 RepID=A0ACC1NZZ3_9PEZI|nr:hypothetical protein NUW58_g5776 [Xylaria curta]
MLAITQHAHEAPELTMAVLGCGTMGIAILSGILASLQEMSGPRPLQTSGNSTPRDEVPSRLPSRFIACVRRPESAKRVKQALWEHSASVKVVQKENVAAVMKAEVPRPSTGKLLISVCAGVTVQQLEIILHGAVPVKDPEPTADVALSVLAHTLASYVTGIDGSLQAARHLLVEPARDRRHHGPVCPGARTRPRPAQPERNR